MATRASSRKASVRQVLAAGAVSALAATPAIAQVTRRVSLSSAGVQGSGHSYSPAISADGRYVAFHSEATNLVPGDTNLCPDVFVHDRQSGMVERVSVDSFGAQGNWDTYNPAISADGRFVAFWGLATNLVPGDTNGAGDVFVRDRQNGVLERISVDSSGNQANGSSDGPSISADGRFVAFESNASSLVPGDTNGAVDVFVRDRQSGTTQRLSVDSSGVQGNAFSGSPSVSADGRYVAFYSDASNLVAGDTNGSSDVFVHDRQNGATARISVDSLGLQANGHSQYPVISAGGRFVAFWGDASNLVTGDTNSFFDVFVHDRQSGMTERVSVDSVGAQGDQESIWASISTDGRYVAFQSVATNLVSADTNGSSDVFVHDRQSGATERVSVDGAGAEGNGYSEWPSISADGQSVALVSASSNLISGDTNGSWDVFVRDNQGVAGSTFTPFCFGDGTSGACRCGNSGSSGNGCANSAFAGGAHLGASGTASVSADSVSLSAASMTGSVTIFFQGATATSSTIIDDGLGCVGGPIIRLGTKRVSSSASSFPQPGDPSISVRGAIPPAGGTFHYQTFYRNAVAAFCPPATSNRTNGVSITWAP